MLYDIWIVGAAITLIILLIGYKNDIGVHIKCEVQDSDFSNIGAFIVCALLAVVWPITWLYAIISLFSDSDF